MLRPNFRLHPYSYFKLFAVLSINHSLDSTMNQRSQINGVDQSGVLLVWVLSVHSNKRNLPQIRKSFAPPDHIHPRLLMRVLKLCNLIMFFVKVGLVIKSCVSSKETHTHMFSHHLAQRNGIPVLLKLFLLQWVVDSPVSHSISFEGRSHLSYK